MQSDEIHALEGLSQRVQRLKDQATKLTALRDNLLREVGGREQDLVRLSDLFEKQEKALELFRYLMDLLVLQQVRTVEKLVTEGLRSIFYDLDLGFESEIGPKFNKVSVDFYFRQGTKGHPLSYKGKPLDSFGGGPSSVASFVLRILTILRLKLWPVVILDEALGAVSPEYVDRTSQFLQTLAQELKADFLLVTHKPAFLEHAHHAYRCTEVVEEGSRHLSLRKLK